MCLCACAGLCNNLHGLRHFVHWKHPRVFASEHTQFELPQVYEVYCCPYELQVLNAVTCLFSPAVETSALLAMQRR